jgi:hypothetical protein
MRAAESATSYADALAAECLGAETLTKLDATRRVFAGTASKLYELSGTSWTDVSAGGGTYTLGATSRWCFAQFGDTSLAATIDEVIQSTSSAEFAAISGAPQATVIESVLSSGGVNELLRKIEGRAKNLRGGPGSPPWAPRTA